MTVFETETENAMHAVTLSTDPNEYTRQGGVRLQRSVETDVIAAVTATSDAHLVTAFSFHDVLQIAGRAQQTVMGQLLESHRYNISCVHRGAQRTHWA